MIGRSRRLRRETGSGVEPNHLDATRDEESEDEEKVLRHSKLELCVVKLLALLNLEVKQQGFRDLGLEKLSSI